MSLSLVQALLITVLSRDVRVARCQHHALLFRLYFVWLLPLSRSSLVLAGWTFDFPSLRPLVRLLDLLFYLFMRLFHLLTHLLSVSLLASSRYSLLACASAFPS